MHLYHASWRLIMHVAEHAVHFAVMRERTNTFSPFDSKREAGFLSARVESVGEETWGGDGIVWAGRRRCQSMPPSNISHRRLWRCDLRSLLERGWNVQGWSRCAEAQPVVGVLVASVRRSPELPRNMGGYILYNLRNNNFRPFWKDRCPNSSGHKSSSERCREADDLEKGFYEM